LPALRRCARPAHADRHTVRDCRRHGAMAPRLRGRWVLVSPVAPAVWEPYQLSLRPAAKALSVWWAAMVASYCREPERRPGTAVGAIAKLTPAPSSAASRPTAAPIWVKEMVGAPAKAAVRAPRRSRKSCDQAARSSGRIGWSPHSI